MTEKRRHAQCIFLSETGKLFANVQGRNEGAQFPGRGITAGGIEKCRQCHKYFLH